MHYGITIFKLKSGTIVEWLEWLGYGAKSRRKVRVRGLTLPCDDWKTLFVNLAAVNGYLFRIGENKVKGERWAPPFISFAKYTVGL